MQRLYLLSCKYRSYSIKFRCNFLQLVSNCLTCVFCSVSWLKIQRPYIKAKCSTYSSFHSMLTICCLESYWKPQPTLTEIELRNLHWFIHPHSHPVSFCGWMWLLITELMRRIIFNIKSQWVLIYSEKYKFSLDM